MRFCNYRNPDSSRIPFKCSEPVSKPAAELIEQRTRTALQRCENSFPRIKFGKQAAQLTGRRRSIMAQWREERAVQRTAQVEAA
jgi:hypothetical protein